MNTNVSSDRHILCISTGYSVLRTCLASRIFISLCLQIVHQVFNWTHLNHPLFSEPQISISSHHPIILSRAPCTAFPSSTRSATQYLGCQRNVMYWAMVTITWYMREGVSYRETPCFDHLFPSLLFHRRWSNVHSCLKWLIGVFAVDMDWLTGLPNVLRHGQTRWGWKGLILKLVEIYSLSNRGGLIEVDWLRWIEFD